MRYRQYVGWDKEHRAYPRRRLHVPERGGTSVERPHRSLSLHHGTCCRSFHPGVAGAGFPRRSGKTDLPPGLAHRALVPSGRPAAPAIAPWTPRAFIRDVPNSPPLLRHGHVWIRLSLVLDGSPSLGNLARLPSRYRSQVPDFGRHCAFCLSAAHTRLHQSQRALAAHRREARIFHHPDRHPFRISSSWIRRLHFWIGKSESLVVVTVNADRIYFLRYGVRHRCRYVALHAHHAASRPDYRHALPRQDRPVSALHLRHRLQPRDARPVAAHIRSRRIFPQSRLHGSHAPLDFAGHHSNSSRHGDPHRTDRFDSDSSAV